MHNGVPAGVQLFNLFSESMFRSAKTLQNQHLSFVVLIDMFTVCSRLQRKGCFAQEIRRSVVVRIAGFRFRARPFRVELWAIKAGKLLQPARQKAQDDREDRLHCSTDLPAK